MNKFVCKKTVTGFMFDLKASNGEPIASSEVYATIDACMQGITSVRKNAPIAGIEDQTIEPVKEVVNPKFELYMDKTSEFRFRLKARNGQIIAISQGYKSKAGCSNGIESVKKNAADAKVENEF